jgi:TetR/AcrR family transcriptional repressor of nem operon
MTAERILDSAERLVQVRGFNGFSYADVAAELQITKASLHYHYASKAELGEALIRRYSERFVAALTALDVRLDHAPAKLDGYAELYARVLDGERMCLCGMLAAEYRTLPEPMRAAVIAFFEENEEWLAHVLRDGKREGSLTFTGSPREVARTIISTLEGALLVSRPYADAGRFRKTSRRLLATLAAPAA